MQNHRMEFVPYPIHGSIHTPFLLIFTPRGIFQIQCWVNDHNCVFCAQFRHCTVRGRSRFHGPFSCLPVSREGGATKNLWPSEATLFGYSFPTKAQRSTRAGPSLTARPGHNNLLSRSPDVTTKEVSQSVQLRTVSLDKGERRPDRSGGNPPAS